MTTKLLTDLADMIEASTIVAPGVIMTGRLSDDDADAVLIRDYGGLPRVNTHSGYSYRYPRVQVLVRHSDPVTARDRAEAIWQLFDASKRWTVAEATWSGTEYQVIVPLGDLTPVTHDVHGRTQIACNYEVRVPNA